MAAELERDNHQSEADAAYHARHGDICNISQAKPEQDVFVSVPETISAAELRHNTRQSGVGCRHYLHPNAERIHVSVCDSGLV